MCNAGEEIPLSGHITKCGVYMYSYEGKKIAESSSATGYVTEGGRIFVSSSTNIALAKGIAFGFDLQIEGAPTNQPLRLTHIIKHPKMRKPNGEIVDQQTFDRDVKSVNGVITGSLWYTLREDYELLPGEWTISILSGNTILAEKKFIIVKRNEK